MQHNARDPLRDHSHGRIYRITYPSRPLVDPPKIHDATIEELFENLKLKEYRARYRTKRELRSRDPESVIKILKQCFDPELPVDLWNLGLIYDIKIQESYSSPRFVHQNYETTKPENLSGSNTTINVARNSSSINRERIIMMNPKES